MTQALGLIEVIGYPPAVEAADSALKAANVKLASITKVDGGIMTVQIFGDVGAVKAAVDAAGIAAAKVGEVRATHVIPRVAPSLEKVFMKQEPLKQVKIKSNTESNANVQSEKVFETTGIEALDRLSKEEQIQEVVEVNTGYDTVSDVGNIEEDIEVSPIEPTTDTQIVEEIPKEGPQVFENIKRFSQEELTKLSNKELKNLIASLGIKVAAKKLKSAKKDELIHMIIQFYKEGEN